MNKTAFVWMWVVIVFALIIAAGAVAWALGIFSPSYYAVYMTTGDLYFGKLMPFSHTLTDVWYLQRDAQGQALNLVDFTKTAWGSGGDLNLNAQHVVWRSKLAPSSPIINALRGLSNTSATQNPQSQVIPSQGSESSGQ